MEIAVQQLCRRKRLESPARAELYKRMLGYSESTQTGKCKLNENKLLTDLELDILCSKLHIQDNLLKETDSLTAQRVSRIAGTLLRDLRWTRFDIQKLQLFVKLLLGTFTNQSEKFTYFVCKRLLQTFQIDSRTVQSRDFQQEMLAITRVNYLVVN